MPTPLKDVYIIGVQCTGKTTLARGLKKHCEGHVLKLRPSLIEETAREVLRDNNFSRDDIQSSSDRCMAMQFAILRAQYEKERRLDSEAWHLFDRSGLDPVAYAKVYAGEAQVIELLQSKEWLFLSSRMKQGCVFLLDGDADWSKDDGVRLMASEDDRLRLHEIFQQLLDRETISYHLIGKDVPDLQERINIVCRIAGLCQC